MKPKTKHKIKKGAKILTKWIEYTGLPHGYSESVAWFAERMVLATLGLMVLAFGAGILFDLRLSEPIAESQFYSAATRRAALAQQGIHVVSQQVIDLASPIFKALIRDNRDDKALEAQELATRKEKLAVYLESKHSPLASDQDAIDALATSKNMRLILAISFVESTLGKHCYYYNCSGIGGTPPNLRKYNSYKEWIVDFDKLLEERYKDVPIENFMGVYVQPGSPNWLYGVKQILQELNEQVL